jgi:DnaA family protein
MPAVTERFDQLTIALQRRELNDFTNFRTGANGELVAVLRQLAAGDRTGGVWLWGETGRGKSHLLEATCEAAQASRQRALYLPLGRLERRIHLLDDLAADLLALDDVDAWLGMPALEQRLMALYQDAQESGTRLLLASAQSAQRCAFSLADLASRCRALPGFEVLRPTDADLREILAAHAGRRGLELGTAVLDFWLNRSPRTLPVLLAQLDALDDRALAEQRRVTIPLIKEVLGL